MKKRGLLLAGLAVIVFAGVLLGAGEWLWRLPFMPEQWRNRFVLNANIIPASDDARSMFIALNPGFRAEFGDKQNPRSAFLRFEKTPNPVAATASADADVSRNLLDSFNAYQVLQDYQPGIEWQLFSVGVDEQQLQDGTQLASDQEILQLTKQILGEELVATASTDLPAVEQQKESIVTETVVTREQGYDVVANRNVAEGVDLQYVVVPGQGIKSDIVIGDREGFDTACLKLLSVTGVDAACNLPRNKFSFLLQLDAGQKLIHTPLSIDQSQSGTYFIVDDKQKYLLRLANPQLIDAAGNSSRLLDWEVRPGQVGGSDVDGYYIVTMTANLSWLIDSQRQFPVTLSSGFYVDGDEFFTSDLTNNDYLLQ